MNNSPPNRFKNFTTTGLSWLMIIFSASLMAQSNDTQQVSFQRTLPVAFLSMDALLGTEDGTIYAAEGFNGSRIFEISTDGNTQVYAAGLSGPIDMAIDTEGNMYVTNFLNASVSKIDSSGTVSHFADTLPFPAGIVIDDLGNLYVSQYGPADPLTGLGTGDAIQKITPSGDVSMYSQGDLLAAPIGITIDENGQIYSANFHNGRIIKVLSTGAQQLVASPTPPEAVYAIGHLDYADQRLYATGIQTQALYKINPHNGRVRTKDISNRISFPNGITYDIPNQAMIITPGFSNVASLTRYPVRIRSQQ